MSSMDALEQYNTVFSDALGIAPDRVGDDLRFGATPEWDSVAQMELISRMETAFGIVLDVDALMELDSYAAGKEILSSKYGVAL